MKTEPKKEPVDFLKYYVKPHKKISREVTDKDLKRVAEDAHILYNLCHTQHGIYRGGLAVAHQQINDKDPLRFFVMHTKELIINPVIINHTKSTIDSEEGCLSFFNRPQKIVQRWNKCEVEYQTITEEGILSDKIKIDLSGKESKVYQHEVDHFDCKYIYTL